MIRIPEKELFLMIIKNRREIIREKIPVLKVAGFIKKKGEGRCR